MDHKTAAMATSLSKPYFDMLPPEVAEIPIKMAIDAAMNDPDPNPWKKHNYLVDVIAKVFPKFKYLAARMSLWQGDVWIEGGEKKMRRVINEFLNDGITDLVNIVWEHWESTEWADELDCVD